MRNMIMVTMSNHGKDSVNEPRSKRFTILLTETEEYAISEYRYANRLPTQAEAARRLIKRALEMEMLAPAEE